MLCSNDSKFLKLVSFFTLFLCRNESRDGASVFVEGGRQNIIGIRILIKILSEL